MEIANIIIEGANKETLLDLLTQEFPDHYLYSTENLSILTTEKYFLRINSDLLSVIILNFSDKSKTDVEIISGGGAEGLLQIGWGSEGSANSRIKRILHKICQSNSWVIRIP